MRVLAGLVIAAASDLAQLIFADLGLAIACDVAHVAHYLDLDIVGYLGLHSFGGASFDVGLGTFSDVGLGGFGGGGFDGCFVGVGDGLLLSECV